MKGLLIADPNFEQAQRTATTCSPLALERRVASTGAEALRLAQELGPEMAIVDFDLKNPRFDEVLVALRRTLPQAFLVASFRELAGPEMKALAAAGADALLPHPFDLAAVCRTAVRRFAIDTRHHSRIDIVVEVRRSDGSLVGNTLDLSLGGMLIDLSCPLRAHEVLVVDLLLPDEEMRVHATVLAVEGQLPNLVWGRFEFHDLDAGQLERLEKFLAERKAELMKSG